MEHLSPEQVIQLKKLLLKRKEDTIRKINQLLENKILASSDVEDEIDSADLEMERLRLIRLRERETKYLKKIEYALSKIENGTYGICENCGKPISFERLKARPVAIYCIDCKKKLEVEED